MKLLSFKYPALILLLICLAPLRVKAYSVLTHEALIDASWEKSLKPLLRNRFPGCTDAELITAHSYAYGGSLMTDIGYSPYGSVYFTDLVHYVRSGDFVNNLISESQNLNEYAYALGALCHYMADRYGHSIGTNIVVPMVYHKLQKKYGKVVTYVEKPIAHSRVEIAFDVLQVARGNYASQAYHDFIGFNVATKVLQKAFLKTYGQDLNTIFSDLDKSVNSFRWAITSLMPTITRSAWVIKKSEIKKNIPDITSRKFSYRMRNKNYYQEFGRNLDKPKFKERVIAFLLTIAPKVGPLRVFRFKEVGPEGEKQFIKSFDTVMTRYTAVLSQLDYKQPKLLNVDFDTGKRTEFGEYELTDKAYTDLMDKLKETKYASLTANLKRNIVDFYSTADTAATAKKDPEGWKKTSADLQELKNAQTVLAESLKITPTPEEKDTAKETAKEAVKEAEKKKENKGS